MNLFPAITKYLPQVVDKIFVEESKTAIFMQRLDGKIDLNFAEAGYVKILSVLVDGLANYHRANEVPNEANYTYSPGTTGGTGYKVGNAGTKWELFKLRFDRGRQFPIDYVSNEELAGQAIAQTLGEFLRTKVIPEADTVRFSTIASHSQSFLGNRKEGAIAANTIIKEFNAAIRVLATFEVPSDRQVFFISPEVEEMISNTDELKRFISQTDLRSESGIVTTVRRYNGRQIITVPSSRFYTDVLVDDNNGYRPNATSKFINFMLTSIDAVIPVIKVEKTTIFGPSNVQDFDGYKVNFRMLHDCFVPKNKQVAVYTHVSNTLATTSNALLMVQTLPGELTNSYKVEQAFTLPQGLYGSIVSSAAAQTLGAQVTVDESTIKTVDIKTDYVVASGTTTLHFSLIDGSKTVIAVSNGAIPLNKRT